MDTSQKFEWMLSVCAVCVDVLSASLKKIVIAWWCSKTHMSPNRKEVVKKRLGGGLTETQAVQYLLEKKDFPETHDMQCMIVDFTAMVGSLMDCGDNSGIAGKP